MTTDPLRILITGSRHLADRRVIVRAICDWAAAVSPEVRDGRPPPVIVHGGARGADTLAGEIAHAWGWAVECHPADWNRYGRAAGPRRNAEMVKLGADICLTFPIGSSPGTRGCIDLARTAGIPVRIYEGRVCPVIALTRPRSTRQLVTE
jgi:hypothetical protein